MEPFCVVIGSGNPVKRLATLEAVRIALGHSDVKDIAVEVDSGVPAQPIGDDQTLLGARNRAAAARAGVPEADLWVGFEGGVLERDGALHSMAWGVALGRDGRSGESRTATFALPKEIAELVRQGVEMGEATDRVFGSTNSKQGSGTVGPLTGGAIDRVAYYAHALVLALIPFRNPGLAW